MKTEPYLVKVFGCRLQSTISSILSSKVEMFWIYSIQQVSSLHSFNLQNSLYSTTSTSKSKNLPTCPHGRVGPLFPVLIPPPTPLLSHTLTCVGSPITWAWWEERAGRVRRCEWLLIAQPIPPLVKQLTGEHWCPDQSLFAFLPFSFIIGFVSTSHQPLLIRCCLFLYDVVMPVGNPHASLLRRPWKWGKSAKRAGAGVVGWQRGYSTNNKW